MSQKKRKKQANSNPAKADLMLIISRNNGKLGVVIADKKSQTSLFFDDREIRNSKPNTVVGMCKGLIEKIQTEYEQLDTTEPANVEQINPELN
ncbi:hypothetical protein CYCD_26800 [Tenuifilaceae bacterium CYCD]|nr:hypothetical protein CYCD_26800 [Tenuifilaceae bacterium CYCD]